MAIPDLNAVLRERVDLAPGLALFRVAPRGWELPDFRAGQFAVLGLPGSAPRDEEADPEETPPPEDKLIRRAYSVASSPRERDHLELFITRVDSGALTPRLFHLSPGDPLWLSPKCSGLFTLDEVPPEKDVILVATGTGLAPYISMLRTHLDQEPTRRYAVLLGARHSWNLGYHDELQELSEKHPHFTYLPCLTRPEQEETPWEGVVGRVQVLWEGDHLERAWGKRPAPESAHVFFCGNPVMVEDMLVLAQAEGFREHTRKEPGEAHLERYW